MGRASQDTATPIKNIYSEAELMEQATCKDSLHNQSSKIGEKLNIKIVLNIPLLVTLKPSVFDF